MKVGLQFRHRLEAATTPQRASSAALEEFQSLHSALASWGNHQHDDDGNHTDITADSITVTALNEVALKVAAGRTDVGGAFALSGSLTPPDISGFQDNYSPVGIEDAFLLRVRSSSGLQIRGIKDGPRLVPINGRTLMIHNVGSTDITLMNETASSDENFRFRLPSFQDLIVPPQNSVIVLYDGKVRRWISLAGTSGIGTASSEFNAGDSGAAITIDWANGPQQIVTLTNNAHISIIGGRPGIEYRLLLIEGGPGGWQPTFDSDVLFENDTVTSAAKAAGEVLIMHLIGTAINGGEYLASYTTPELSLLIDAGDLTLVDDTTNDVTDAAHGFAPKSPGDDQTFLNGGSTPGWTIPIRTLQSSDGSVPGGNTVANTVAETAFASTYTIPADDLEVGDVLRVTLRGVFGTDVISPTIQLIGYMDVVPVADTGAMTLGAASVNEGWTTSFDVIVTSLGVTGSVEAQGAVAFYDPVAPTLASIKAAADFTVDTTGTLPLTVTVTWGAADADNTITLRQFVVERLRGI